MNRTLHLCWLVDAWRPTRERYLRAWQERGWHCVLWHSGQLKAPPVPGVELARACNVVRGSPIEQAYTYELKHRNHASCADLFRYQVLISRGGSYADIDILPGRNASPTLPEGPLFGLAEHGRFEIRFIRCPKQHAALVAVRDAALRNQRAFLSRGGYMEGFSDVVERTGPHAAVKAIERFIQETGLHKSDLTLDEATIDDTPENLREGHRLKMREVMLRAARHPWRRTWRQAASS